MRKQTSNIFVQSAKFFSVASYVSRAVPAESVATSRVAARTMTTKLERNISAIFHSSFGNPRFTLRLGEAPTVYP